jgi:hypothetical protein
MEASVDNSDRTDNEQTRRSFIKTAAYVAPAILTLKAAPAFAAVGSGNCNNGPGNGVDCAPRGLPPLNDGPGTSPGNPGRQP